MKLKIAFLQLLPADNMEDNLEIGLKACKEAKNKGADIALFPEMWSIGYRFSHDKNKLREQALPLDSDFLKQYSKLAEELDVDLLRDYRKREVWGVRNRRPELYRSICLKEPVNG